MIVTAVEERLCADRRVAVRYYIPLAGWEKVALRLFGISPPDHFYQLKHCEHP
jgi:hypothetical protein